MDQNVIKPVFVIKTTVITRLDAKVTVASILVSLVNLEMSNYDVYGGFFLLRTMHCCQLKSNNVSM